MESFSLLNYWRGGGAGAGTGTGGGRGGVATSLSLRNPQSCHASATLGATALRCAGEATPADYYGDEDDGDDCSSSSFEEGGDDEGPFFDLEFAVPDEEDDDDAHSAGVVGVVDGSEDVGEAVRAAEFGFAVEAEEEAAATPSDGSAAGLSPSHDDLFFKGRLLPLESPSSATTTSLVLADPSSRQQHQFLPVSTLLKSATRFRVFALGLKKVAGGGGANTTNTVTNVTKTSGGDDTGAATVVPSPKHPHQSSASGGGGGGKFFTVKYMKVVEEVPIMSLFSRDSSSRSSSNNNKAAARQSSSSVDVDSPVITSCVGGGGSAAAPAASTASDEKKFSKELVHKYLNMIKPLYVRVSKRHADKLEQQEHRSSPGHQQAKISVASSTTTNEAVETAKASLDSSSPAVTTQQAVGVPVPDSTPGEKQLLIVPPGAASCKPSTTAQREKVATSASGGASQHLQAGLRVVCKHLGKSRSASSAAVAAAPSPPPAVTRRRDDSLLQQQDGIQSAIAHCKRSFNAPREANNNATTTTSTDTASLPRSRSDSCDEQRCGGVAELAAPQRISADNKSS